MYNKVIFIGNLTKDPELRHSESGTAICSFRIAVNTRVRREGEWTDEVLFIGIVVFGKQAENCGEYLNKGSSVLVEGRLKENRWEAEGQQKSRVEVTAQTITFLSKKQTSPSTETGSTLDSVPDGQSNDTEPF